MLLKHLEKDVLFLYNKIIIGGIHMKKIIICCLVISLVFTTGCGRVKNNKASSTEKQKETNKQLPESGKLPDKKVNGLSFTETSISYVDDMSTIVSMVKNTTKKTISVEVFEVIIKDKKGKVLVTIPGFLTEKLEPGETKPFTAHVNMDLSSAVDIEYKL